MSKQVWCPVRTCSFRCRQSCSLYVLTWPFPHCTGVGRERSSSLRPSILSDQDCTLGTSFNNSKKKVLVTQSCPTLCDPMVCSPPGSPVHEILQARVLEWVAIPFSRGSSQPRDWAWVYCLSHQGSPFSNSYLLKDPCLDAATLGGVVRASTYEFGGTQLSLASAHWWFSSASGDKE